MNRVRLTATALTLLWCAAAYNGPTAASPMPAQFSTGDLMVVASQLRAGEPIIRLKLVNGGIHGLELRRADLPWFQRTMLSAAVRVSAQEPLPTAFELESPEPGRITLEPKGSTQRDIDLTRWFPAIGKALERDDIVFLWRYSSRATAPPGESFLYGGLTLKRRP
jgi:hypothetical protein